MARYDRLQVLNTMIELGLVPVFYNPDVEVAKQIVAACRAGGARVVEFTNRGDFAFQVYTALAQHVAEAEPDVILGVGSVIDAPTAALYISAGANFVVGPVLNPEIGLGYGFLWNVLPEDLGLGRLFFHTGAGIHMLAVMPDLKVVVVHRVDTHADDIRFTGDDLNHLFGLLGAALVDLK